RTVGCRPGPNGSCGLDLRLPTRAVPPNLSLATLARDLLQPLVELLHRPPRLLVAGGGLPAGLRAGPRRRVRELVLDRAQRSLRRRDLALERFLGGMDLH